MPLDLLSTEVGLKNILSFLKNNDKTLLCLGPLSTNIIHVATEFSNAHNLPIVLVASRRQFDTEELGAGYVNNWCTEQFVAHVRNTDSKNIYLARDHGGPWQGAYETKKLLGPAESMSAAKKSFEADIAGGLQLIHIDPTIQIGNEVLTEKLIRDRLFELYGHICEFADSRGKEIAIEVGTEEQNGKVTDIEKFSDFLNEIKLFAGKNKFSLPLFTVYQTGAKVMELKNVGTFEAGTKAEKTGLMQNIRQASDIARRFGLYIKEHNSDYLAYENLKLRPLIGIKGANVAPELGAAETKCLTQLLLSENLKSEYDTFVDLTVNSGKWRKWTVDENTLSPLEKTYIAGHYCYSHPAVIEIKNKLQISLSAKNQNMDQILRNSILEVIKKYATAFNLTS